MLTHTVVWAEDPLPRIPKHCVLWANVQCDPPSRAQVSRIDELVYGFALDRFFRDASKANFQLARRA